MTLSWNFDTLLTPHIEMMRACTGTFAYEFISKKGNARVIENTNSSQSHLDVHGEACFD